MHLHFIFHFPVTGVKKSGICSCSTFFLSEEMTSIMSRTVSGSAPAGVKLCPIPWRVSPACFPSSAFCRRQAKIGATNLVQSLRSLWRSQIPRKHHNIPLPISRQRFHQVHCLGICKPNHLSARESHPHRHLAGQLGVFLSNLRNIAPVVEYCLSSRVLPRLDNLLRKVRRRKLVLRFILGTWC
jgi:hypothetical protein